MRLDITMERLFEAPVDRVWRALTEPEMIERWLMSAEGYEARVGVRFTLRDTIGTECRGRADCEVLELVPPRRMVWSWRGTEDPARTRLVIELEASDGGTRLTLRHTGEADERTATGTTRGWTEKLRALTELLANEGDDGND